MLRFIKRTFLGYRFTFGFFRALHKLSLVGMNIAGDKTKDSGEKALLKRVQKYFSKKGITKPVIFDVGGNLGDYSSDLIEIFGIGGLALYTFEPSAKTYSLLRARIPVSDNVHLINKGLSDKSGSVDLYQDKELSGASSVYHRNTEHLGMDFSIKEICQFTTLPEFCASERIEHIHFLKLDIEGHELPVLSRAGKLLDNVDFIQFEFGGCNIDSKTYFQEFYYLLKDHFNFYYIMKDGLAKIGKYEEWMEIFITTNFLLVNKKNIDF